jgi:hypothetical protein
MCRQHNVGEGNGEQAKTASLLGFDQKPHVVGWVNNKY